MIFKHDDLLLQDYFANYDFDNYLKELNVIDQKAIYNDFFANNPYWDNIKDFNDFVKQYQNMKIAHIFKILDVEYVE